MTKTIRSTRFVPLASVITTLFCVTLWSTPASAGCTPPAPMKLQLESLQRDKWVLPDSATRQALAIAVIDCLGAPDPVLRDELAYEALSAWMRNKQLMPETLRTINGKLQAALNGGKSNVGSPSNQTGFLQPFAALALAEVARVDRVQAFLTEEELARILTTSTKYLTNVRDYRGFVDGEGWRHGVAHGADLMLQLALNQRLTKPQLDRILAAIASQVTPQGEHFYRYREGERLMAPVFYIARRDVYQEADWSAWIATLTSATNSGEPTSQVSLTRRHNLSGFLLPLYFSLRESGDAGQRERLLPAVTKAVNSLN